MDNFAKDKPKMSLRDESYFCLLCLHDSTERIVKLYCTYIQFRQLLTGEVPPVLVTMLLVLQEKQNGLHERLLKVYPGYMASGKWHNQGDQLEYLDYLSEESRGDLQQIYATEMKLLILVSEMMKR